MAKNKAPAKNDDSKIFAFLGVFLTILGFLIAILAKKDNDYVMFYAKQGLVLFIGYIIALVLMVIPIIGFILGYLLEICLLVLWIIGWINALSGEKKDTPVIGALAQKFNF